MKDSTTGIQSLGNKHHGLVSTRGDSRARKTVLPELKIIRISGNFFVSKSDFGGLNRWPAHQPIFIGLRVEWLQLDL
jgi:hypothetical protein